jgi:DUF1009 family protein
VADRLGLIAGGGDLPLEIARAAQGRAVFAVGFPGITDPALSDLVDALSWQTLGRVSSTLTTLREAGVVDVVLAGKIQKNDLIGSPGNLRLDDLARNWLARSPDLRDGRLLSLVGRLLESEGFSVLPQSDLVPHLLPAAGQLGKLEPTREQLRDLAFGWPLARQLADADIGQCIAVKHRAVVAVEALEGTDAAIARATALVGHGLCVIKLAARGHDPRFDLPTVGPSTLLPLIAAGGGVLAVEAGRTLVLHRDDMIDRADHANVAVLAIDPAGPGPWEDSL